jgi:hypothetical protein
LKATSRPEQGREERIVRGDHPDLAGGRHDRELRHPLSEQAEPPREIAAQAPVDEIPDDADAGARAHRQRGLVRPNGLHELAEHDAAPHRDEPAAALLMEVDRREPREIEDHRGVARDGGGVRRLVPAADARHGRARRE